MKYSRAVKLAVECIDKEIQRGAVEANLHDIYKATYSAAVRLSKRRKALKEAKECLLGQLPLSRS